MVIYFLTKVFVLPPGAFIMVVIPCISMKIEGNDSGEFHFPHC